MHRIDDHEVWPPQSMTDALRERNVQAYLREQRKAPYTAILFANEGSIDDICWLASLDYDTDYDDCQPLLHSLVNATNCGKRATFLRVLALPGINIDILMGRNMICSHTTPLEYALSGGCDWAVTQLLKAGADTSCKNAYHAQLLRTEWSPCRAACVAALVAFLGANRKRRCMPRDVALLVAHRVWAERYDMEWMGGAAVDGERRE